ncbi:hypothetical protein [Endozoicomonas sp. YOMI1]|uniref:hypothetical protein n=1 Tax=Endozoicomonas sp. YOMI1 TaxID=2828739 RepID=UPI00214958ED|nr:hypothetical protein [Endozoicomonas sp. YOMI1]
MSLYQQNKPSNQTKVEEQLIRERIGLLSERQWQLTADDFRRCKISIDYNLRLLDDTTATMTFRVPS